MREIESGRLLTCAAPVRGCKYCGADISERHFRAELCWGCIHETDRQRRVLKALLFPSQFGRDLMTYEEWIPSLPEAPLTARDCRYLAEYMQKVLRCTQGHIAAAATTHQRVLGEAGRTHQGQISKLLVQGIEPRCPHVLTRFMAAFKLDYEQFYRLLRNTRSLYAATKVQTPATGRQGLFEFAQGRDGVIIELRAHQQAAQNGERHVRTA